MNGEVPMRTFKEKIKNFSNSLKRNGIKTEIRRAYNLLKYKKTVPDKYAEWILLNEPNRKDFEIEKKYISKLNTRFLIITSKKENEKNIVEQTYNNYNVIVSKADEYAQTIKETDCDFCVFLGDDIELQPFTLFAIQDFIEHNECNLIYSDNDFIENEKRVKPEFKPHFAYNNILSKNYFGNFIVVKTKFLLQYPDILENLNEEEAIYDMILRCVEKQERFMHIDMILYHKLDNKFNKEEQKKVLKNHLDRMNVEYENIRDGEFEGQYKIDYKILNNDKVSIVIPNMDHIEDLKKCIESIQKSTYKNYEIIVVENNSKLSETFEYYKYLEEKYKNVKIIKMEINEFNYSKIVNYGVENSDGQYIVMLNNDIEIINEDWIEQMLMYVQKEDVGICGARLYFDDNTIQHAGVIIGIRGLAGHRYREVSKEKFSSDDNISYVQELSAVTAACFMVKREDYQEVLGFDEKLAVAFNDVDFCLKIRKLKKLIIYNPFVEAFHYESKSRGEDTESKEKQKRFAKEYEIFVKRWRRVISKGDPYFSVNYRLDTDIPEINYNKIN